MMKFKKEMLCLFAVLCTQTANANTIYTPQELQQITSIESKTNPGRIGETFVPSISGSLKTATPVVGEQVNASSHLPPEFHKMAFHLKKLTITGATAFSENELAPIYQKYVGKKITLAELFGIAQAITDKYHAQGFLLSQAIVPAQRIQSGTVTIQVIEGYINKVAIQGDAHGAAGLLQRYGEQIKTERPLRAQTLERYSLLANDIPGLEVQAVLAPSKTEVGAADLTFITKAKSYNALVSYDNRGTVFFGPYEITAQGSLNNIVTANQTGIQSLITKDFSQLNYTRLWHTEFLGNSGLQLQMAAALTRTNPGAFLEQPPFSVSGQSTQYTADLSYPIIRSRRENLSINLTFDILNSVSYNNFPITEPAGLLYKDNIRSLRLGANYQNSDSWLGVNSINLITSQGFNVLGAPAHTQAINFFGQSTGTVPSRSDGESEYTKFNLNVSRLQYLPNSNWSVLFAGAAQYALNPLLSPEQIGFGGRQFGRAYDPSEITGDSGVEASAELRYTQVSNWALLQAAQYYVYYDGGVVWNRDVITQFSQISATSAGLGVRFTFTNAISGGVEVDKPLTLPVGALTTPATPNNPGYQFTNPRVFFYIQGTL